VCIIDGHRALLTALARLKRFQVTDATLRVSRSAIPRARMLMCKPAAHTRSGSTSEKELPSGRFCRRVPPTEMVLEIHPGGLCSAMMKITADAILAVLLSPIQSSAALKSAAATGHVETEMEGATRSTRPCLLEHMDCRSSQMAA
jgi:hypothetical protein